MGITSFMLNDGDCKIKLPFHMFVKHLAIDAIDMLIYIFGRSFLCVQNVTPGKSCFLSTTKVLYKEK